VLLPLDRFLQLFLTHLIQVLSRIEADEVLVDFIYFIVERNLVLQLVDRVEDDWFLGFLYAKLIQCVIGFADIIAFFRIWVEDGHKGKPLLAVKILP
jgi:hypothetical protein